MAPPTVNQKKILLAQAAGSESRDPLYESTPAIPKTSAPQPVTPTLTVAPAPEAKTSKPSEKPKAEESTVDTRPTVWDRLHLVVGGGYNFGGRIRPNASPFNLAAPEYSGGLVVLQPTYRVLHKHKFNVRVGADVRAGVLNVANSEVAADSRVNLLSFGALGEVNYLFDRHFGIGLNAAVGYMGLKSKNADVGAPFSATLGIGDSGNVYIGAQGYISTLREILRVGVSIEIMGGNFKISTTPGGSDLVAKAEPNISVFFAFDAAEAIRALAKR
jgi:hypothetical protein